MHISLPTLRIAVLVIGVREDKLFFSVQIQSHHEQYLLVQFLVHIHWKKPGNKELDASLGAIRSTACTTAAPVASWSGCTA